MSCFPALVDLWKIDGGSRCFDKALRESRGGPCHHQNASPHFSETLRKGYAEVLAKSASLPPAERLVMYDPHDDQEVSKSVGPFTVRLDSRRGSKPRASVESAVVVCAPVDPFKFNFTKIQNAEEKLYHAELAESSYAFLTNKFPLCSGHMLLVASDLVPQMMTPTHLSAVRELLWGSTFFVYFNSWGAAASVNHFHMHVIDERPPLMNFPLMSTTDSAGIPCLEMKGYPSTHYVFPLGELGAIWKAISLMQQENQPHNLFFSASHVYVFPRESRTPERSLDLYGEKPGGLEFAGIFTVYSQENFDALTENDLGAVLAMNATSLACDESCSTTASCTSESDDGSSSDGS